MSRTPIREILIALEKDGLVQRIRNQGANVISFTPDDLEELYDLRCALECLAVRRAVLHIPLNQLLEFEQRLAVLLRDRGGPRRHQRQAELDVELHRFIVSHSGNRRLITYLENVSLLPLSLRLAGYKDDKHASEVGQEHLMLVRALLRRDSQLAEELMARHIENGKRKMLDLLCQQREARSKLARPES
jgi:DNA-binding GntR family transcriptional regulator